MQKNQRTITEQRLAIRWANAKDGRDQNVLEGRNEEKSRVFKADNVELVRINDRRDVPVTYGLLSVLSRAKHRELPLTKIGIGRRKR